MYSTLARLNGFNAVIAYPAEKLQSLSLLGLRLYASWMFFPAGLLKVQNWGTTLFLFEEEYQVPLLSPVVAAWLGTMGELLFPLLLTLGLFSRFSAAGLFIVNLIAVLSLAVVPPAAMGQHVLWGLAMFVVVVWGPGKLSADQLLSHWVARHPSSRV
ncbi:DoxX family protein [Parahaliea mediterranea]|uniref:DoxX family protein n=1 Tax=Parahaliea mediterranea TaxID=651086 RepID=A0A939DCU0_9GAMM|nr:DoxX family protein [Parahaliea mediterranea]MBN7795863.1 DoxX family protein [Parahaliea mediterranea]